MIEHIYGNLIYFTFESFDRTGAVKHCFSSRNGGVSQGVFESMNLHFRNDEKENVIENYKIICGAIGVDYRNVVFSNQVHDDRIYCVDENDRGKGLLTESDIENIDGLITDRKDVVLTAFFADCVPVYFLDPAKKIAAVVHSGWRGTVKQIGPKAVLKMVEMYGCDKKDILAGIGPSIGKCCFEVDYPVVSEFEKSLPFSESYIFKDIEKEDKYKIDLRGVIRESLIYSGIDGGNIETADLCTKCRGDLFFSHRRMGSERGSMAGLITLC